MVLEVPPIPLVSRRVVLDVLPDADHVRAELLVLLEQVPLPVLQLLEEAVFPGEFLAQFIGLFLGRGVGAVAAVRNLPLKLEIFVLKKEGIFQKSI